MTAVSTSVLSMVNCGSFSNVYILNELMRIDFPLFYTVFFPEFGLPGNGFNAVSIQQFCQIHKNESFDLSNDNIG